MGAVGSDRPLHRARLLLRSGCLFATPLRLLVWCLEATQIAELSRAAVTYHCRARYSPHCGLLTSFQVSTAFPEGERCLIGWLLQLWRCCVTLSCRTCVYAAQFVAQAGMPTRIHSLVGRALFCIVSLLCFRVLAIMQGNNYQYTTSEIELHFTRNERRTTPDSPPTTNASRLECVCHGGGNVLSSEDRTTSLDKTVPSIALDSEFPNAPLLEKHPEMSQGWPTSPQPVKGSFLMTIRNILVDILLLALSLAFLAFALFVVWYNDKPTSHHPQAAERIQQASIWVRKSSNRSLSTRSLVSGPYNLSFTLCLRGWESDVCGLALEARERRTNWHLRHTG